MLPHQQPSAILRALADASRLQLFELLLRSDRTNSELIEKTDLRQSLLSHHLKVMAECGLIRVHPSAGDSRRHYYSVDLVTAQSLGEWWSQRTLVLARPLPALKRLRHVLFLCLYPNTRSLMAEQLARHLAPRALTPVSAGLRVARQPPSLSLVRRVLEGHGVPVREMKTHTIHDLVAPAKFDYVIALCDIVHEDRLPLALDNIEYLHWSLREPLEGETDDECLAIMQQLYHELVQRITFFVQRLAHEEA